MIETLLTEDQKRELQAMRRRQGGGPGPGGPPGGRPLFRALRYANDFPGFLGKRLTPGEPLDKVQPPTDPKPEATKKG